MNIAAGGIEPSTSRVWTGRSSQLSYTAITKWIIHLSGRQDSNLRPPGPKPGALPSWATSREKQMHLVGVEPTTFWFVVRHSIQLRYGCIISAEDRDRTGTVITNRRILSPVRLPIPPPRHYRTGKAEDGIRTRDPHHGKVMFYHWTTSANVIFNCKCRLEDSNLRPPHY